MSEIELTNLRRAALALLLISIVRWWAIPSPGAESPWGSTPAGPSVDSLVRLSEETRAASDEAERRARPLEPDEWIDPNVASEIELDRLPGVGPSTARAIVAARSDGAVFRRAHDLVAVRGIGPRTAERMGPHLVFGRAVAATLPRRLSSAPEAVVVSNADGAIRPPAAIDINLAPVEALVRLPGIGPALAERIVKTRRAGRFHSLEELTRVPGIGPATVARLDGLASVGQVVR